MREVHQLHLYPVADDKITAFSTTRHGGCGSGSYGTFNCTPYTGDEPTVVRDNQKVLCRLLGIATDRLVIPYQTHSCNLLTIDSSFVDLTAEARQALLQDKDAVMTDIGGLCLCVSTADCIPVLLYDATHGAIAAVHAGWRGTVGRIVTQTLQAMYKVYGTVGADVHAIIGPGISLAAFEVGMEVYETFREAGFDMEQIACWYPEKEKYHIDLPTANRLLLMAAGVPNDHIYDSGICTYTRHHDFFSARRLGIKSGRILNGIILRSCETTDNDERLMLNGYR